jgi:hypothetical protein
MMSAIPVALIKNVDKPDSQGLEYKGIKHAI